MLEHGIVLLVRIKKLFKQKAGKKEFEDSI